MDLDTILAVLSVHEKDERLNVESHLRDREYALGFIAVAEAALQADSGNAALVRVMDRLAILKGRLAAVNERLFDRLRTQIRHGRYTPERLRSEFNHFTAYVAEAEDRDPIGLDNLDMLLDNIMGLSKRPGITDQPDAGLIYYQPTPARVMLDLVDHAGLAPEDVFYDIGSGMGRAVILVHLLSGVRARGVEIDPARHQYALDCANQLRLSGVEFLNADARDIDYADGTVFFMYTPFQGATFQELLDKLHHQGRQRALKICTYGACTAWVAQQPWLQSVNANVENMYKLGIFHNLGQAV